MICAKQTINIPLPVKFIIKFIRRKLNHLNAHKLTIFICSYLELAMLSTKEAAHDLRATLGECRMPGEDKDLLGLVGGGSRRVTGVSSSAGLGKEGLVTDFNKGAADDVGE